jgi:hypothetical protein
MTSIAGTSTGARIDHWHAAAAGKGEQSVSVGGPCPADLDMLKAAGADVGSLVARLGRP